MEADNSLFLFADDTTVFLGTNPLNSEILTFQKINQFAQFFSNNKLSLNTGKTGYVCIWINQRNTLCLNPMPSLVTKY